MIRSANCDPLFLLSVNILLESTGFFSQIRIKSNSGTHYLCLSSQGDVVLQVSKDKSFARRPVGKV